MGELPVDRVQDGKKKAQIMELATARVAAMAQEKEGAAKDDL